MLKCSIVPRTGLLLGISLTLASALPAQFITTHLSPRTDQAFEDYRKAVEAKLDWNPRYVSGLKAGEISIAPVAGQGSTDVPDGLVHDWIAAAVVPHASPEGVIGVLQNYAAYKNIYSPDVIDSKLVGREGDRWRVHLKLLKKKVLTARLNGEFEVEYHSLGNGRWSVTSRSVRIAEMDGKRELPIGEGQGFLWRVNQYWLIEPRPEGVYMECRIVSLSRDIPTGLAWVVKPFVTSVPKESLYDTMQDTIRALGGASQENPAIPERKIRD
jgi:hypothetical protein